MENGIIKYFNKVKGFGFIVSNTTGKEVPFTRTDVNAHDMIILEEGQSVRFTVHNGPKGPQAKDIRLG